MNELQIYKTELPNDLKNPFGKTFITDITVSHKLGLFGDKWYSSGWVEFKNNNTTGNQKFKGSDFNDVVSQIKTFIESLN